MSAPAMGVSLTFAFAPYGYAYAAFPALMFLYRSWTVCSLGQAAFLAYLFGLGFFGTGIWWVYISMHDFGGADPMSACLLTLLLVGVWALFPAMTALFGAKAVRSAAVWARISCAALTWVTVEYIRGYWLLNGFPWLQIAYSQLETPLAGYAPLFGVYGVGFLLAASAFTLAELLSAKLPVKQAVVFLLLCSGMGGILKTVAWTRISGPPVKITLIQGNISQEQKWLPEQKMQSLDIYRTLTEQNWRDTQVIIWPESAIPAFYEEVKPFYLTPLTAEAIRHNVDLVVSLPSSGAGMDYFNSVLVLGARESFYHKSHLLPFGEYLPLQPLSGWILDSLQIPLGSFTAGAEQQTLLTAGGYAFVTTICYEDAFGELVSRQIADAAYIVNVTNDAWFGHSSEAYQHMQMAQMRALENGRYLARATNTGITGFIAPDGSILKQAPMFTRTALTETIMPMTGVTPYAQLGDSGVFAILLVSVLGVRQFNFRRKQIDPIKYYTAEQSSLSARPHPVRANRRSH